MFWRKKSSLPDDSGIHVLATKLGVEKRFTPRIAYPPKTLAGLPTISYQNHLMRVFDLSVGGCSLIDPTEIFGPQVGQEFQLSLAWSNGEDLVRARLVGRVDHRRNFQFIDLPLARQDRIKHLIAPGVRGADLRASLNVLRDGPSLEALEVWSSPGGDSVTLESHLQRVASVYVGGKAISILRTAWPQDERNQPLSRADFDALILFLSNIPRRSPALADVLYMLEELSLEVRP